MENWEKVNEFWKKRSFYMVMRWFFDLMSASSLISRDRFYSLFTLSRTELKWLSNELSIIDYYIVRNIDYCSKKSFFFQMHRNEQNFSHRIILYIKSKFLYVFRQNLYCESMHPFEKDNRRSLEQIQRDTRIDFFFLPNLFVRVYAIALTKYMLWLRCVNAIWISLT